jgi:hypothetical protein
LGKKGGETQNDRRKDGRTNFTLRVREQALRLNLRVHDDGDDDDVNNKKKK